MRSWGWKTNEGISDLTRRRIYWQHSLPLCLSQGCVCVWCQDTEKADVWEPWSSLPENDDAGTLILDFRHEAYLLTLSTGSFAAEIFLILMKSNLSVFSFMNCAFLCQVKESIVKLCNFGLVSFIFQPCFSYHILQLYCPVHTYLRLLCLCGLVLL